MDASTLVASLQEAVPAAQIESVPSVDLHATLFVGRDELPHVASVISVWPSANWLEREVWDLFGIAFDGHPDPRRLLMPEDWDGFPLRKDYPVQIRKKPGAASALQVSEDEFRANVMKDRLTRG